MKKRYYIAYGSNLNIRQMLMRCPDARVAGTSVIEDYQLLFKGSKTGSYLTIEPKREAVFRSLSGRSVRRMNWHWTGMKDIRVSIIKRSFRSPLRVSGPERYGYEKHLFISCMRNVLWDSHPCGTWQLALRDTDPLVLIRKNCGRHMPTAKGRCENGMQD